MNADNYGSGLHEDVLKLVYQERQMRLVQAHWNNRYGFCVPLECSKDCPVCKSIAQEKIA